MYKQYSGIETRRGDVTSTHLARRPASIALCNSLPRYCAGLPGVVLEPWQDDVLGSRNAWV